MLAVFRKSKIKIKVVTRVSYNKGGFERKFWLKSLQFTVKSD